jgi:hypothetical protein
VNVALRHRLDWKSQIAPFHWILLSDMSLVNPQPFGIGGGLVGAPPMRRRLESIAVIARPMESVGISRVFSRSGLSGSGGGCQSSQTLQTLDFVYQVVEWR